MEIKVEERVWVVLDVIFNASKSTQGPFLSMVEISEIFLVPYYEVRAGLIQLRVKTRGGRPGFLDNREEGRV